MDNEWNPFVPNVRFELIRIRDLVSNQDYQRNISIANIRRAAEHFDLYQINPVKVSRRNGINYVFDGQHTVEIIALVSGSRDTPVWCMVYDDLIYEHEADIFANQKKYTKNLTAYEIFAANVEAGNPKQLMIKSLVESYGLYISPSGYAGSLNAVGSLEYIHDKYGYHILDLTLRLVIGTWEGEGGSFSSQLLKGIAMLLDTYGDNLREDIFKEKVGRISLRELCRTARELRNGSRGYAIAMANEYNRKNKYPLHISKLYSNKKRASVATLIDEELKLEDPDDYEDDEFGDDGEVYDG